MPRLLLGRVLSWEVVEVVEEGGGGGDPAAARCCCCSSSCFWRWPLLRCRCRELGDREEKAVPPQQQHKTEAT
jgi:hypothetical protein